MNKVCTIGLDIAKNKFKVHGEDKRGVKIFNIPKNYAIEKL